MSTTIREQLRTLSFVEGLTDTALHQLSHLLQPADYACDELLYSRGDERKIMAIVVSGAVAIEKSLNGRPIRVATLGPGEAVGEGLLLDDRMHGTTARALTDSLRAAAVQGARRADDPRDARALRGARRTRGARHLAAPLRRRRHHVRPRTHARLRRRSEPASSTTCSASARFPTRRCTASRRCARSRTSRSPASPLREFPSLIDALAAVKEAAALANAELGLLPETLAELIVRAAREIRSRPASRALPGGHDPGRRRHVDEHERERGDREPRARAARPAARRLRSRSTRTTTSTSASPPTTSIRRR